MKVYWHASLAGAFVSLLGTILLAPTIGLAQCTLVWKPAPGKLPIAPGPGLTWINAAEAVDGWPVVAGNFSIDGAPTVINIARWNGQQWVALGSGLDGEVHDLKAMPDGLWAGGGFTNSATLPLNGLARWDGSAWSAIDPGSPNVAVTAIGTFGRTPVIARWNQIDNTCDVAIFKNGAAVQIGGPWDGRINAIENFQGQLVVGGGSYVWSPQGPQSMVQVWNGQTWSGMNPLEYAVRDLAVWNGKLAISGDDVPTAGIGQVALWDGGSNLTLLGTFVTPLDWYMEMPLHVFNGHLLAGQSAYGYSNPPMPWINVPSALIEWNGKEWTIPDQGIDIYASTFYVTQPMTYVEIAGDLHVFGSFSKAGGTPCLNWGVLTCACPADCDASGGLNIDDFICFQTNFALGDPAADCDGNGTLSIDDFICFQTFYALGC